MVSSAQTIELMGAIKTKLAAAGSMELQTLATDPELNQIVVGADTGGEAIISGFCTKRIGKEFMRLPGSNVHLKLRGWSERFQGTMSM